jgi:hypothetical protein
MTQLVQTLNNYSLRPLNRILSPVANFFIILANAYVEARTKQAAYETVKYLRTNRDFSEYSEMELFDMVMNRTLDSVKKKG